MLPALEAALEPFEPRPHWGKLSTMPPEAIRAAYPRLPDFVALVDRFDPNGTFQNDYVRRVVLDR